MDLGAGTKAQVAEEPCSLLSYTTQSTCPGWHAAHRGLALPHQSLVKKMLHRRVTGQSAGGDPWTEVASPK